MKIVALINPTVGIATKNFIFIMDSTGQMYILTYTKNLWCQGKRVQVTALTLLSGKTRAKIKNNIRLCKCDGTVKGEHCYLMRSQNECPLKVTVLNSHAM